MSWRDVPPELATFLADQDLVALFHASDIGTRLVVKAPTVELESLGGIYPVGLDHQLWAHPAGPVIRTLLTFYDVPETPLRLETFTHVGDPDQRAHFAALAAQEELNLLFYDELPRHRLSKRIRNATAEQTPTILAEADRLLAAGPPDRRDFERARTAIMEVTDQ
jgi:hypothetical protein